MADPERLELPTPAFEAQCSIQLSYGSDFMGAADFFIVSLVNELRPAAEDKIFSETCRKCRESHV